MHTRLAEVLEEQGRTVTWFCRQVPCDRSLYYRILAGERRPTEYFRRRASLLLGVPASLLFLPAIVPDGIDSIPDEAEAVSA